MPQKQKSLTFTSVGLTPQQGNLGLTKGTLVQVSVIGLDATGALVDDVAFTLLDPTGTQIVQTPTPARSVADPRLFIPFNPNWPIEDTSGFQLTVQRLVAATGITVVVTLIWDVPTFIQT